MPKTLNSKRPSKLTRILLAPFLAVIFLVGWTLTYIAEPKHKKQQKPISKQSTKQETIEFMVIPAAEEELKVTC
jgi:hypothetical protein